MSATLEHANITVSDADRTVAWMRDLFGWHVRWEGPVSVGGRSVHVGTETQYLALFQPDARIAAKPDTYATTGGLNHLAVTVPDIDKTEEAVRDAGFEPVNHAEYEPGRRFYFHDHDGIEYEVVQYD
jgi:catechol 2,3-dioxygenase-like lactoylglutathione lyase family enzyme